MAKSQKSQGDQKKYRVSGASQLVIEGQEFNPGDEFVASLEPTYEAQMLMGGHLEL